MLTPRTGVSYFGNRNPKHLPADLREMQSHNCTFVVHTFSENDQQFYKASLAEMIAMSKDAGLQVYLDPWGVGRVFGGETYSSFALNNLETCQILPDGQTAPAVCLNHPKFREFMQNWIRDAAEIGADVLFWDEPHFYIDIKNKKRFDIWHCTCKACAKRFHEYTGRPLSEAERDEIIAFREDCVAQFLEELCESTHAHGMKNAVCMLPFKDKSIGMSDWARVASIPALDIFGTDPYWMFFDTDLEKFVGDFSEEVFELSQRFDKEPQIWLQAYKIEQGRELEIQHAAGVAYKKGIRNFAAWSYYGNAYMSYNRSDDPERVWHILGEIFGRVLKGQDPV